MNDKDKKNKSGGIFGGRGFYIALFMCVALVGVYAWALLFDNDKSIDPIKNDSGYSLAALEGENEGEAVSVGSFGTSYILKGEDPADTDGGSYDVAVHSDNEEVKPTSAGFDGSTEDESVSTVADTEPDFFIWPVSGEVSRDYSVETLSYDTTMSDWRTHAAVDISAAMGSKVLAVADGKVESIFTDDLMGTTVVISHNGGLKSVYSNLGGVPTVSEGQTVEAGTVVGCVSDTAIGEIAQTSHLHFAMEKNNAAVDPVSYLPKK